MLSFERWWLALVGGWLKWLFGDDQPKDQIDHQRAKGGDEQDNKQNAYPGRVYVEILSQAATDARNHAVVARAIESFAGLFFWHDHCPINGFPWV